MFCFSFHLWFLTRVEKSVRKAETRKFSSIREAFLYLLFTFTLWFGFLAYTWGLLEICRFSLTFLLYCLVSPSSSFDLHYPCSRVDVYAVIPSAFSIVLRIDCIFKDFSDYGFSICHSPTLCHYYMDRPSRYAEKRKKKKNKKTSSTPWSDSSILRSAVLVKWATPRPHGNHVSKQSHRWM